MKKLQKIRLVKNNMDWLKKHDVFSKILAVLIALVLWLYVAGANDFEENLKIKNISPYFVGIEELAASKNLMIVGEYNVDVEVSGSRNDILFLNEADIRAEVDLSMVSSAGTYELPYTVTLPSSSYTLRNKNVKAREILETTRSSTIPFNRVRGNTLGG